MAHTRAFITIIKQFLNRFHSLMFSAMTTDSQKNLLLFLFCKLCIFR